MTTTYKILFDLEITHTYFETGYCEGLIFQPSDATNDLINRYSLKYFLTNKGFQFYSTQQQSNKDFLDYLSSISEAPYFEFYVNTIDASFYQFTSFPVDELGTLMYDSSHIQESDMLVMTQQFDAQQASEYLLNIKIYFKDLINQGVNNSPVHYRISFVSRTTLWQYNIINNSKQHLQQLSVKGDSDVEFDEGKEVLLENGQEAICFTSKTGNIPYSEVPKYKFDLINTVERLGNSKPKTIFKGLPMPNPNQLQVISENQQKLVVSPTYVYI